MSKSYQKIWTESYGKIPKDENGNSFEIHHIDGNRQNNNLKNLICLSIKDHYKIHWQQKDYYACLLISKRMNMSENEKQKLKDKIIESNKTRIISENLKKKMSEGMKKAKTGWIPSKETRKIWSEQRKGKEPGNKGKKYKLENYPKNRKSRGPLSPETIAKMSLARKLWHEQRKQGN